MDNTNNKTQAIVWLKTADYMHAWLQNELGCTLRVKSQKVLCVQHLAGAREILTMETVNEKTGPKSTSISMSSAWKNCLEAGLALDRPTTEKLYSISRENLQLYIPIECPKMTMTEDGTLRPWTLYTNFSKCQARKMQELLRNEFWRAVSDFADRYAVKHTGERYAQADMVEAFCAATGTPDLYVDPIRREWQRRVRRACHGLQT